MANERGNVFVGVTGYFMKLDPEEQVITSAEQEITGIDYGYISEDGIEITPNKSTENRRAWQNGDVVRVLTEEADISISLTLIEDKPETRELYYGSPEIDGKTIWNPSNSVRGRFALAVVDPNAAGGKTFRRLYVFDAEVSSTEATTIANNELLGYGITLQVLGSAEVFSTVIDESEVDPEEGTED